LFSDKVAQRAMVRFLRTHQQRPEKEDGAISGGNKTATGNRDVISTTTAKARVPR
jgi:hypothetical protein